MSRQWACALFFCWLVLTFGAAGITADASVRNTAPKALVKQARKHFGAHAREALSVARCESRFYRFARNGQYLGFWQMGSQERASTGWTWWSQAKAAALYWKRTGKDWSAWSCKP